MFIRGRPNRDRRARRPSPARRLPARPVFRPPGRGAIAKSLLHVDGRRFVAIFASFGHDGPRIEDHQIPLGQPVFDFDLDVVAHSQDAPAGS